MTDPRITVDRRVLVGLCVLMFWALPVRGGFEGRFLGQRDEQALDLVEAADGAAIVLGAGRGRVFLMKYRADGRRQWIRRHRFRGREVLDGQVAVTGPYCVATIRLDEQTILMVFDGEDGGLRRQEPLALAGRVVIRDLAAGPEGQVVAAGSLQTPQGTDPVLLVIDSRGRILQTHDYPMTGDQNLVHVSPTRDGGYVATGNTTERGLVNLLVLKTAPETFQAAWSESFPARVPLADIRLKAINAGQWVTEHPDGGYLVAGTAAFFGGRAQTICLRLDAAGQMLWRAPFNGRQDSDLVGRFVGVLDADRLLLVAEKRLAGESPRLCMAQLDGQGRQLDLLERIEPTGTVDLAAVATTRRPGVLFVQNVSVRDSQLRTRVETFRVDDVDTFFREQKQRSVLLSRLQP